jgi:hypothetical protein
MQTLINTRADLDAIQGTPEHAQFMGLLASTLWRLEKDDVAHEWRAVKDNSVVERFGFTRSDFPDAVPPELPEFAAPLPDPIADISPRQMRMALTRAGLREAVEGAVAAGSQDIKDWYEFSTTFERNNEQVVELGAALGVTKEQLDGLWALGATL